MRKAGFYGVPCLQGFAAYFLTCLTGSTVSSWLLSMPVPWMIGNYTLPTFFIVGLLMFYSPNDVFYQLFKRFESVLTPFVLLGYAAAVVNSTLVLGVDRVRNSKFPPLADSMGAQIFVGFLSGCGGRIANTLMNLNSGNWTFQTPSALTEPALSVKAALFNSIVYVMLTCKCASMTAFALDNNSARAVLIVCTFLFHLIHNVGFDKNSFVYRFCIKCCEKKKEEPKVRRTSRKREEESEIETATESEIETDVTEKNSPSPRKRSVRSRSTRTASSRSTRASSRR